MENKVSMSRTIEDIELNNQFYDKLWSGENLPKDYAIFTKKEYFANRKNNMLTNLGKELTDWELPELKNGTFVNPSKLKGKCCFIRILV